MSASQQELFRKLPSVDEVLKTRAVTMLAEVSGRAAVVQATRKTVDQLRAKIVSGELTDANLDHELKHLAHQVEANLRESLRTSLRTVVNATGVVLHTNLGRAPLSPAAIDSLRECATKYSNLEFDIERGQRGKRDVHAQRLFSHLFDSVGPAPVETVVVNNNAAAVLLVLNALAEGGEVIVSRGELVEIGGSFRIPDVMSKSGAVLREVGTTNRTRISDYERAITERTRMLLRVHRSNFEIVGFTEQPTLEELIELGRKYEIPVVEDLGSGALVDLARFGIANEPNVFDSVRAGVAVVTYSGDKLLGGPQSGLITGVPELIRKIRSNPLFRALRVDKLTYGVLEQTLLSYLKQDYDSIPALKMMAASTSELKSRADQLCKEIRHAAHHVVVEPIPVESMIGGGAAPGATLPSFAVAVSIAGMSCDELATALRQAKMPIIVRVDGGRVLLDLRTIFPEQHDLIVAALKRIHPAGA